MRTGLGRVGLMLAAAGIFATTACETTQQHAAQRPERNAERAAPGAMPTGMPDITPRLNASTYVAHGQLLEQQGRYEQAAAQYREALKLTPNLASARNRLGIVLNRLGRHAEASDEFRTALQTSPQTAHVYNNLGFSLYLEGKYDEAQAALSRALELQPAFARAHMNRGLVFARLQRFDEALGEFSLAVSPADAQYNLALVQREAGHYADAARALEAALRLNPDFAAAREQLREVARRAAAEPAPETAVAADPTLRSTPAAATASDIGPADPLPPSATEAPVAPPSAPDPQPPPPAPVQSAPPPPPSDEPLPFPVEDFPPDSGFTPPSEIGAPASQ